jgi:putative ABC transport system substrate-binding protein
LIEKRVQLLRDMFPKAKRLAVMFDEDASKACQIELDNIRDAGRKLGFAVYEYPYSATEDLKETFDLAQRDKVDAALVPTTFEARRARQELLAKASESRLPMMLDMELKAARAGGLMSYGPERGWAPRRAADFVARILRGARPSDLPVEQATRYELVINSQVARALGIGIPGAVLLQADRVIE